MFFRLDREGLCNLNRFYAADVEFVASRRTTVLTELSGDDQRRFLRETGRDCELVIPDRFLADDRLKIARAISNGQEVKFSAVPAASQPSTNGDFLSDMLSDRVNRDHRHLPILF